MSETPATAPQYAIIHVKPTPDSDAWPIVERVRGGWQSGVHHYPDASVLEVNPVDVAKVTEARIAAWLRSASGRSGGDVGVFIAELADMIEAGDHRAE